MTEVKPYLLLGQRAIKYLKSQFNPLLSQFALEWIGDQVNASVHHIQVLRTYQEKLNLSRWLENKDKWIALVDHVRWQQQLVALLWHDEKYHLKSQKGLSPIMQDVAIEAMDHLMTQLLGVNPESCKSSGENSSADLVLPAQVFKPGSGAIIVQILLGEMDIALILSAELVSHYLNHNPRQTQGLPALQSLRFPLKNKNIPLIVNVAQAELTTQELMSLQVGDIITMDTHVAEPAMVELPLSGDKFAGYLGKQQGQLVLRLQAGKIPLSE